MKKWPIRFLIPIVLLLSGAISPGFAFPPQSIELLPGYKPLDSFSKGSPAGAFRYFIYFPSYYLGAGVGWGSIQAKADNPNLVEGSDFRINPLTFTLKVLPPHPDWIIPFFEIGFVRPLRLHYELDPSIRNSTSPGCGSPFFEPCTRVTLKKRTHGYHLGAGAETIFKSGIGIGLHYAFLFARPLERTVEASPGADLPPQVTVDDVLEMNMSVFSFLISYHF